jgi:hypothetical protein
MWTKRSTLRHLPWSRAPWLTCTSASTQHSWLQQPPAMGLRQSVRLHLLEAQAGKARKSLGPNASATQGDASGLGVRPPRPSCPSSSRQTVLGQTTGYFKSLFGHGTSRDTGTEADQRPSRRLLPRTPPLARPPRCGAGRIPLPPSSPHFGPSPVELARQGSTLLGCQRWVAGCPLAR